MIDLQDETDGAAEINMTPMIDCVFLLLIFFLVASTLKKIDREIPLNLPTASSAVQAPTRRDTLTITINADGQTFIDTTQVTPESLLARVRAAAADNPDMPIRINADRATAYENVMGVIDQLQAAGFQKVGLKTLEPTAPTAPER